MRFIHIFAILVAAAWLFTEVPSRYIPKKWQGYYDEIRPKVSYTKPPENKQIVLRDLDLDQVCPARYDDWRRQHVIEDITIKAVNDCMADNPWDVAVSVLGANRVTSDTLSRSLLAKDSVTKKDDLDKDGDPDVIEIRLEVMELNGKSPDQNEVVPQYEIAPGITPGLWVFSPKSKGMSTTNMDSLESNRVIRLPAPVIRIEEGDQVNIILENSHYMPHTIHLHGADHPFKNDDGSGNDGVPIFSEHPTMPGSAKRYGLKPRQPGTMFYHCHVQPQAHIFMGLQGMLVVEKNEPNNWLQTFNIGGGAVRFMSAENKSNYDAEYDLHYFDIDSSLNDRIQEFTDPRLISRSIHREYNVVDRKANYYLLNGRSFPYTLRESLISVKSDQKYRLRVLNGGGTDLALHFHGHKPLITHIDGVPTNTERPKRRDVFKITTAQRVDLELNTTDNGLDSFGEGAWLMHDHYPQGVTSNGIGPGGGLSMVAYPGYLEKKGLPKTIDGFQQLAPFFSPAYYRGEIPVFVGMKNNKLLDPDVLKGRQNHSLIVWAKVIFLLLLIFFYRPFWKKRI